MEQTGYIRIEPTSDGYYYVYLTQNPSCYAMGETEEEAYEALKDIIVERQEENYYIME